MNNKLILKHPWIKQSTVNPKNAHLAHTKGHIALKSNHYLMKEKVAYRELKGSMFTLNDHETQIVEN